MVRLNKIGIGNMANSKRLLILAFKITVGACIIVLWYVFPPSWSQISSSKFIAHPIKLNYMDSAAQGMFSHNRNYIARRMQPMFLRPGSIQWKDIDSSKLKRKVGVIQDGSSPKPTQSIKQNTQTKFVIILAYMHTSSSYTLNVMRSSPGSVMFAEPLEYLEDSMRNNVPLFMQNGTIRTLLDAASFESYGKKSITNLLLCKPWNIDILSLWKYNTKAISTLWQCPQLPDIKDVKKRRFREINKVFNGIKNCSPRLVSLCNEASLRGIKTTRMSMEMARDLLASLGNVKIIHLLRDPRAMLDSNVRRHEMSLDKNITKFKQYAQFTCETILNDLNISSILNKSHPGTILTVRYEDMTDDPMLMAKHMVRHLDIPFTKSIETFVVKKNSDTKTRAAVWRTRISEEHLHAINKHCGELYNRLSYSKFESLEEVRNLDIPGYTSAAFHD